MDIQKKIKNIPNSPGVYFFKDHRGQIIYIGKAASLKKRLSSYFYTSRGPNPRTEALLSSVSDIDYLLTTSEAEALILEQGLIKEHQPKYNVDFKDDKSYPVIKINKKEKFPRVLITRKRPNHDPRSLYFGPYPNAKLLKEALKTIRRLFGFRTCVTLPKKACLDFHLNLCPAPCVGKINQDEYMVTLQNIILLLEGKRNELLKNLSRDMSVAAQNRNFELAAQLRNQIQALTGVMVKKKMYRLKDQLQELKEVLHLPQLPDHVETFDVSNLAGQEAVGSMVSFKQGRPDKSGYRRFKIKSVKGIDDYRMIRELIQRRYQRLLQEKGSLPNLIMVDGGKGQLSSAWIELKNLGLGQIPVIGLAKQFEQIYTLKQKEPITLPKDSAALRLLQRIRDEAHRFALSYHHTLRDKQINASLLDEIEGVGPKRRQDLLKHFGSVENIRKSTKEQLLKIKSINEKIAQKIIQYLST